MPISKAMRSALSVASLSLDASTSMVQTSLSKSTKSAE